MNPLFHTEFSISDSLKNVRKSVLIYETIILDDGELICEYSSSEEDLLAGMIEQEERKALFLAITALPVQMKEILMESIYFQLSDEEIAKAHGLTKENVRQIRCRAKKKLISSMKEGM